jgi:tryptophan halogenase
VVAEQFNRTFRADMESARDVLILHYRATPGRSEPFWRDVRAATPPQSLSFKIESFVQTGRIVIGPEDLFKEASWFSVLMGQGVEPQDYNPLAAVYDEAQDLQALQGLRAAIADQASRAEPHAAAIARLAGPQASR